MEPIQSFRSRPWRLFLALALLGVGQPSAHAQSVGCLWKELQPAPIGRFEAGNAVIDDQLYLFGGYDTLAIEATSRSDRYVPATDQWVRIADLPEPVTHTPLVVEGRTVWALGGFVGDHPGVATANVWLYDADQDQWTPGPALPRPIAGGGAVLLDRTIHYVSGCEADRVTMSADHWAYDLDAPALGWQPRAALPLPRCHMGVVALGGEIWVIGGQIGHDMNPVDVPFVHRYRADLDAWAQGPFLPRPRSHFEGATFAADGRICIGGGQNQTIGRALLNGMLELDPALGSWSYLPQLPFPRQATCVRRIGGDVFMAGGSDPGTPPASDLYRRPFDGTFESPLRINCGGGEIYAAGSGCCDWSGDIGAENGRIIQHGPNTPVAGTDEDAVFWNQRGSADASPTEVAYRFPMGNGFFRVRAFLSELSFTSAGQRVLDLSIEDRQVIENLDLAADPGFATALTRTFDVEVVDHVLNLQIGAAAGQQAMVAALEIERLDDDLFATECTSLPNSTGLRGTLDLMGTTSVAEDDLTLRATGLPAGTLGLLIQALQPGQIPIAGGLLCVTPPFFRLPPGSATGTELSLRLEISNPPLPAQSITAGSTWHFQCWYRDGASAAAYGLTDALRITFTP